MPTKKNNPIPSDKVEFYQKLIDTVAEIELKGSTMPYTSHNGHMFSFLDKEGKLALRLSKEDRENIISQFNSSLFKAHGTVLKEYVEVPEEMLKDTQLLSTYLQKSFNYMATLKPKPTKKPKK